jgi:hypothetical protein
MESGKLAFLSEIKFGEGVGTGGEMTQALYAHMNNKTIKKNKILL